MIESIRLSGGARYRRSRPKLAGAALTSLVTAALLVGGPADAVAASDPAPTTGWAARPPVQIARVGHDIVTVNGGIFAIGGFNPNRPGVFNSVEARLVDGAGAWRTVAPMPTARANVAVAVDDGTVYAVGGFTDDQTLDVVEAYDPAAGSWSSTTKLPAPRGAAGAASLGGLLYVAGGLVTAGPDDDEVTASVLAYSPATRSWRSVAPMPTARWRLRLVAAGGRLYAIGGQSATGNTLPTVERYDPKANSWTSVAPMTQDRGVPGVVAVNHGLDSLIVVIGGCQFIDGNRQPYLRSTEVYNLNTDRWHPLQAELPSGRCSLGAAVEADGSVLAISGASEIKGTVTATTDVDALKF